MDNKQFPIKNKEIIRRKIYTIRNTQVMLDSDLSYIYGVETKTFNQAVKRNINRFPEKFRFELTKDEYSLLKTKMITCGEDESLRSQNVTLKKTKRGLHKKYLPSVFTEQGIAMLSAVLKSQTAVDVSICIMNTFVEMRRFLQNNTEILNKLDIVERRQISFELDTNQKLENLIKLFESDNPSPKQGIFYEGQVYDSYIFICDLIKKAKKSLVLIDNYIDESVLTIFAKRTKGVSAKFYTKSISKQLALDLKKHNEQYPPIEIHKFKNAHDRFLIIDESEVYHIGASLKDLGNKWFAFSKFETGAIDMLKKLRKI